MPLSIRFSFYAPLGGVAIRKHLRGVLGTGSYSPKSRSVEFRRFRTQVTMCHCKSSRKATKLKTKNKVAVLLPYVTKSQSQSPDELTQQ